MTQATTKDYWISPSALHIELNALGYPDYIQASCVSGAQILVYVKDIIGFDAGHNYRRWPLQAVATVFNTHTEKYVYVAIPRDMTLTASAWIVFPSEQIDIYGKNEKEEQIGDEKYYYIFLQGIITSSGDNGTVQRDWKEGGRIVYGYLSSDEAISAIPNESEWYNYSDGIVTFLKDITMKAGTKFRQLFAKTLTIMSGGKIAFENQGEVNGVAIDSTSLDSVDKIVTPNYLASQALSKINDDIAQGIIRFMQGLKLGNGVKGIDANGNAVLGDVQMLDAVLRRIVSLGYNGATQQGFGIVDRGDGKFRLDINDLQVWGKAVFQELEVRKLSYAGGNVYLSGSGSKIFKTEELYAEAGKLRGWRCWLLADDGTTATQNMWRVGDQARCQTFGLANKQKPTRSWWRLVTAVSEENVVLTDELGNELYDGKKFAWIEIAKDNCELGSDVPMAGDTIVLDGNQNPNERERQGVMILETTGANTPRIVAYKGVVGYTHEGCEVFYLSPQGSRIVSTSFEWVSPTGDIIHIVNYRGEWQSGVSYGYYDQVSHGNGVWLCTNINGSTTEPKEGNADWQLVMKAEKGEKGDDGVAYQVMITSDTGTVMINGSGKMTLNATLLCNGEDISDTVGNSAWLWWRKSADAEDDAVWNRLHESVGRSCLITRDDVDRQAQFGCRVYISDTKSINSK
ncbi:hypothetical protein [Prevotella sp.]|uniref:hypothetical protein n=1 Tax=Prevotella sp. TaxID=59823 RepID=UPI0025F0AE40|nr:hypothetical protein [Prevotella sp.]